MTPQQWDLAKKIFGEAIALEPGKREGYVRWAAGGDDAVCAEVISLVKAVQ